MIKYVSILLLKLAALFMFAIMLQPLQNELGAETMEQKHINNKGNARLNRLIHEKSPYLLQHASNPVDWYPWCEEAFEKARRENKPIFLSIGYSTCHWCHVMAHESFEDPEVAKLLNETFVSIKVDREERPDIDNIYMNICRMLTGGGGWPLTIIMTPDKKPFYAGTYIPKENRYRMMGMLDLIPRINTLWASDTKKVIDSSNQIVDGLRQNTLYSTIDDELDATILKSTYTQLSMSFDNVNGGFGDAPKFPSPQNILFLLRYWKRADDDNALDMVEKTLQSMRNGGMCDHVGFGFHRYATDSTWLVPHFEKMLYDQAMLAMAYTETYQATGKAEYKDAAREIFAYVLRDMTSSEGGFYSAEDADSEGEEGAFYLWTVEEVEEVLGKKDADLITRLFNITADNKSKEAAPENLTGRIPHLKSSMREFAVKLEMDEPELRKTVDAALQKMFIAREKRVHPHKDDKILTDWNGLMVAAFAKGARVFGDESYSNAAKQAIDFILKSMRRGDDNRLLHRYRDGDAAQLAYVDDYSFLIWGLLELYETTFDAALLQTAIDLNNELIKHFWDEKYGGFFFTADDGEKLLIRQKEFYDGAIPSGNSIAMLNTIKLARIIGDDKLESMALKIVSAFAHSVKQAPSAFTQFMVALNFVLGPSYEIVVAGDSGSDDTLKMLNAVRSGFIPNKVVIFKDNDEKKCDISRIARFTKDQKSINGKATAYVCLNYSCKTPTTDIAEMMELIK